MTLKQIAEELGLKSVKTCARGMYVKLGAENKTQAVIFSIHLGLFHGKTTTEFTVAIERLEGKLVFGAVIGNEPRRSVWGGSVHIHRLFSSS